MTPIVVTCGEASSDGTVVLTAEVCIEASMTDVVDKRCVFWSEGRILDGVTNS